MLVKVKVVPWQTIIKKRRVTSSHMLGQGITRWDGLLPFLLITLNIGTIIR